MLVAVLLPLLAACTEAAAPPLPELAIDSSRVAVAGLSSGAYMATQVHLAYSNRLLGAALIAGGPYACAQGSLERALGPCISADPFAPDAAALAAVVRARAEAGLLAPLSGLAGDRVLVLHGRRDQTVAEATSLAAVEVYRKLALLPPAQGLDIQWDGQRDFGHLLPTEATGGECGASASPYLGRCGFDAAGLIMRQLFAADAAAATANSVAEGELRRFDQRRYLPAGEDAYLADRGYVYLPKRCLRGESCGLLIAFHGCQQNAAKIGEAFVRDAGFNRWADAMAVVVLYPQTRSSYLPLNPKACWDWWGYSGPDYDTRKGVQLRWLANAALALGAPLE